MAGIVIFGGTTEGRRLAESLQDTDLRVYVCVATEYGASLLPDADNISVYSKRMTEHEMEQFLQNLDVGYCLDATHPYAVEVTKNIVTACERIGLPYIRILRREIEERRIGQEQDSVLFVENAEQAAAYLCHTSGNIFLTTGSKELEKFTIIPDYKNRCIARVLPTLSVMEKCKALGFEGRNLIGMQGPFSEEMNYCMFRQTDAKWVVTKNSGSAGGYQEKCEAALRLGICTIVIGRPEEQAAVRMCFEEALSFIKEKYSLTIGNSDEIMRRVYLVAMGPGDNQLLTREAARVLESCDVLIGARRVLEIWDGYEKKPHFISYKKDEIVSYLRNHPEYRNAAVCYSGDIGFYSGAKGLREYMESEVLSDGRTEIDQQRISEYGQEFTTQSGWKLIPVSGISSVTFFLNRIGVSWDDVKLVSCHGKQEDLLRHLSECGKVCTLLGDEDAVSNFCEQLTDAGMQHINVTVGERLSYPDERIVTGCPDDFIGKRFDPLSILLVTDTGRTGDRS